MTSSPRGMPLAFEDWVLVEARPGKRIYSRFDTNGDLLFMEEWDDDLALEEAALARQMPQSKDIRQTAVIPDSVRARALREGWYFDDKAWKRWMNDSDNRKLRVSEGRV